MSSTSASHTSASASASTSTSTSTSASTSTCTSSSSALPPPRFVSPTISISTLSHTTHVPLLGLGTFRLQGDVCRDIVTEALRLGYRRIDTAQVYYNESILGSVLSATPLPRSSLFITSKIHPRRARSYEAVLEACRTSIKELEVEYVDLYLVHWPGLAGVPHNSPRHVEYRRWCWQALEQLVRDGVVHHIGISNYTVPHLTELMSATWRTISPVWCQIEIHPCNYSAQHDIIEACHKYGIVVEAYSSLGQGDGRLMEHDGIKHIAKEATIEYKQPQPDHITHESSTSTSTSAPSSNNTCTSTSTSLTPFPSPVTPAQVLLAWGLHHGFPILPRTSSPARLLENALSLYVHLTPQHMSTLDEWSREKPEKFAWDPTTVT